MTIKDSQVVAIHPSTTIDHKPEWVLYHEFVLTKKNYIRTVTDVKGRWLLEIAPEYFNPASIRHVETRKELEKVERELLEERRKAKKE
jgi:pre-mRNA-splicing factor ATP-dependent RNA helicase DHX15/PRP43